MIGESGWAISRTLSGVIYCVWLGYTPHALWRDLLCLVGLTPHALWRDFCVSGWAIPRTHLWRDLLCLVGHRWRDLLCLVDMTLSGVISESPIFCMLSA